MFSLSFHPVDYSSLSLQFYLLAKASNPRITQIIKCGLYICNAAYTEDLILIIRWHGNKYFSAYMNMKNNSVLVLKHELLKSVIWPLSCTGPKFLEIVQGHRVQLD